MVKLKKKTFLQKKLENIRRRAFKQKGKTFKTPKQSKRVVVKIKKASILNNKTEKSIKKDIFFK